MPAVKVWLVTRILIPWPSKVVLNRVGSNLHAWVLNAHESRGIVRKFVNRQCIQCLVTCFAVPGDTDQTMCLLQAFFHFFGLGCSSSLVSVFARLTLVIAGLLIGGGLVCLIDLLAGGRQNSPFSTALDSSSSTLIPCSSSNSEALWNNPPSWKKPRSLSQCQLW